MNQTFSIIVIGAGTEAEKMVAALAAQDPRCGWAVPTEIKAIPFETLHALVSGQEPPAPLSLPSSVVRGEGPVSFRDSRSLSIGSNLWRAEKFVLATGARPEEPAVQGLKESGPFNALDIAEGRALPPSLIVLGGGPLACALTFFLQSKGHNVTLIAGETRLLPSEEPEISATVAEALMSRGVRLELKARVLQARRDQNKTEIVFERDENRQQVTAEAVLTAESPRANTEGLNLKNAGVFVEEGGSVVVNDEMRASRPGIWAIGGATGTFTLNETESQIAIVSANIRAPFFAQSRVNPDPIPYHLPLHPPLARIGHTEAQAKTRWRDARAAILNLPGGCAKIIARKRSGQLLGASLFCEGAPELALYFNLAFQMEISLFDLDEPQHNFPQTLAATARQLISAWLR